MEKTNLKLAAFAIAALCATGVAAQDIPAMPVSVLAQAKSQAATTKKAPQAQAVPPGAINEASVLTMTPGVNQVIPVAIGHPNRVVTPFSAPDVVSTSLSGMGPNGECGEVCIKDNVVYVATEREHPVTMFITEKGSEAQALSVTMVPRKIPPREVFLKLDEDAMHRAGFGLQNPKAEAWEKSQPYIEAIRSLFRGLALGDIPQGYAVGKPPRAAFLPNCDHPGLEVDFEKGQFMKGHSLNVFVGVATNVSDDTVEFKEAWCGGWDVAAAAVWPRNLLQPGEKTEVFVAVRQITGKPAQSQRRSLLD